MRVAVIVLALLVASWLPAAMGHHSQAPFFDQSRDVQIEGIVQRFDYRNPHAMIYVDVSNQDGVVVTWTLQMASLAVLIRAGIGPEIVAPGDRIRALGPSWNEAAFAMASVAITTEDGREYVDPLRSGDFSPRSND
jgi:hypothetical protein